MNEVTDDAIEKMIERAVVETLEKMKPTFAPNVDDIVKNMMKFGDPTPKKIEPGSLFPKYVRALGGAKVTSKTTGEFLAPKAHALKIFGENDPITKAMAATTFADGGALIPPEISADLIELLRPASVVRSMNPVVVPLARGQLSIPKITGGASFQWIGENKPLGTTGLTTGNVNLVAHKGGTNVPVSNDLFRRTDPGTDTMIRDDLVSALAQGSDLAYIRGNGQQYSPKGLRNWAPAANVSGSAGTTLANMTTDLQALMLALLSNNVRMLRPGWLLSPRSALALMFIRDGNGNYAFHDEMAAGRLNGYPFRWTTQIPINLGGGTNESEIYFVDFADVVIGDALDILVEVSTEATYTVGGVTVSAWENDQSVVRALIETDLVMRHAESVAVKTGVLY